jgi:cell division protein FtsZ
VQINFGVVLNEQMGDEVKITVIATGFERENLPMIERRAASGSAAGSSTATPSAAPVAGPPPVPESPQRVEIYRLDPVFEAVPEEPVYVEAPQAEAPARVEVPPPAEPVHEEPLTMAASANGHPMPSEPLFDDLDIPAILRRDRRFLQ